MYFINKNGNIASSYEGRLLFIDNEDLPIKLVFNKQEDDYYICSNTMGYWVRYYDKQIEAYFSRFNSVKSLYADIKMRGGTIFFDDKVRVLAGLDANGHHVIWFETTVEFDESMLSDLGYTYRAKGNVLDLYFNDDDNILAQYSNENFVITKSISNHNQAVVHISIVDNEGFDAVMHISLNMNFAPSLCIPVFDLDGKKSGNMIIQDICISKPETVIKYMSDIARAKFSGEKINNLVINSFILPDDTVYVREVLVDYNEGKSGVFIRKIDESDCIYEDAKKLGTYMTKRRFEDVFCK